MSSLDLSTLHWRKSSRSSNYGNCVEVAFVPWRKSSRSSLQGNCVEVAFNGPVVATRDSKDPDGGSLVFAAPTWASFVDGLRAGRFDA
ncbi:DUF397 domain-containing protein [Saccharopolyspora spinosa]|uniref:Uncharacterized protein DUF397 n=1 Tax=Saccharopolyspora spinosa TaxID=60894 RepID=A0A2N3Y7Z4_SACSN|nr:DUF397 domain-containing protein [Saccharopolyspora spinosa]PKW19057.1 uncharacterized protein DUF397 [Saccharopolyspora spinosa]